ncbi:MAG: RNA-dependent RNA polymerase [Diaphorina citri cimodo-like virus]|nr:MAG: RNA-dependent RNA polymerase [Diaphorina citri cimodo-like virus]
MPRDAILLLLKSYNTKIPVPCNEDINVMPPTIPNSISNPPPFNFGNVTWVEAERRPIANEYRYIYNFDIKTAIQKLALVKRSNKGTNEEREANLIHNYLYTVLNQSRSMTIARLVLSTMMFANVQVNDATELHFCREDINPSIYYLQQLLLPYVSWPFLDVEDGMVYPYEISVSTQLPLLIYSTLNRSISYITGVITTGYFNLCMSVYLEWAEESIDDLHLLQKGKMNMVTKLLNETVMPKEVIPTYSHSGIDSTRSLDYVNEFWLQDEKDALLEVLKQSTTTKTYFKVVADLSKRKLTINQIISHKMALECCTNNSTFKKSSPTLEYDRSAEHHIKNPVVQPPASKTTVHGFPLEQKYTNILKDCVNELDKFNDDISERINLRNLENEYWNRLTNNSAGMTRELIIEKRKNDPILNALPEVPYGQRYVSALIDNDILYNRHLALSSLSNRTKAGKREQIDRRSRWIMMVLNVLQCAFSIVLSYGQELAKLTPYIASGKQIGDVRDMLQSLRASSDPNTIITDNDIRGMDSHTQEQIAQIPITQAFKCLTNYPIDSFFFARRASVPIRVHNERGDVIQISEREFSAAQVFLMEVISKMRSQEFEFSEGWLAEFVAIEGSVFWSGAFHTAVQHNTFLAGMLHVLQNYVNHKYHRMAAKFNGQVLGDDISLELIFRGTIEEQEEAASNIIAYFIESLRQCGFQADPESSRFQATFLQQTANFGKVKPKHARLSIVVSERSDGRKKDPFGQVKEVGDLLDEMSARCPIPENVNIVLLSYWTVMRHISYGVADDINENLFRGAKWVAKTDKYVRVSIPFVAIYLPEIFGAPMFPGYDLEGKYLAPSFFMPKGLMHYWLLFAYTQTKLPVTTIKESESKSPITEMFQGVNRNVAYDKFIKIERAEQLSKKDVLDEIGFGFAQTLFEIVPKANQFDKKVEHTLGFQQLVRRGIYHLNSLKVSAASRAETVLREKNIDIPRSVGYVNQPENRIKQAFALKNERSRVMGATNSMVIKKLIRKVNHTFKFKYDVLVLAQPIRVEKSIKLSPESRVLGRTDLGPCAKSGSRIHSIQLVSGTPFNTPSKKFLIESIVSDLPFGADGELILSTGAKIYRVDPGLMNAYFTYLGVDIHKFEMMRRSVVEYIKHGSYDYSSVYNSRKYFYVNTSVSFFHQISPEAEVAYKSPKLNAFVKLFTRDVFFTFPHEKETIQVHVPISLRNYFAK